MATTDRKITIVVALRDLASANVKALAEAFKGVSTAAGATTVEIKGVADQGQKTGNVLTRAFSGIRNVAGGIVGSIFNIKTALLGLATTLIGGRVVSSILNTAEELDNLAASSRKTGVAVQELSKLRVAAKLSNVEFDTLTRGIGFLSRALAKLNTPGGKQVDAALNALGISDARRREIKSAADLLPDIADGLTKLSDARKALVAQQLFGRAGQEFLPLFEGGAGKLKESLRIAQEFNLVLSPQQVAAADRLTDALDLVRFALEKVKASIIGAFGDQTSSLLERFAKAISALPQRAASVASAIATAANPAADPKARTEAAAAVQRVFDSSIDLVFTIAKNIGRIIATAVIEALAVGLTAISPTISRVFRDAIGPLVNELVPGLIEPTLKTKIEQLEKAKADIPKLQAELDQAEAQARQRRIALDNASRGPRGEPGAGAAIGGAAFLTGVSEARVTAIKKRLEEIGQIDKLRAQLAQEQAEQAQALAGALQEAGDATATAFAKAKEQVGGALGEVNKAVDATTQFNRVADTAGKTTSTFGDSLAAKFKQLRDTIGSAVGSLIDFLNLTRQISELRAAELTALGQTDEASRIELQNKQLERRKQLLENELDNRDALSRALSRVEAAETRGLDITIQATKASKAISDATDAYEKNLQVLEAAQRNGAISKEAATVKTRELTVATLAQVEAQVAVLEGLKRDNPEFIKLIEDRIRAAEAAQLRLKLAAEDNQQGGFFGGLKRGFGEFINAAGTAFEQGRKFATDFGNVLENNVGGAVDGLIDGTLSLGQAFKKFIADSLIDTAKLLARLALMNALQAAFSSGGTGGGAGGGLLSGLAGLLKFDQGGIVPGNRSIKRDVVPAMLRPGERVFTPETVDYYDRHGPIMEAIHRRLIPPELLASYATVRGGVRMGPYFAQGGEVGRASAGSATPQPVVAIVPNTQDTFESLLNVGFDALLRRLGNNAGRVRSALGIQASR